MNFNLKFRFRRLKSFLTSFTLIFFYLPFSLSFCFHSFIYLFFFFYDYGWKNYIKKIYHFDIASKGHFYTYIYNRKRDEKKGTLNLHV